MAYHNYRTRGIVLWKENRGEADQLFFVFTEKFGEIQVMGRAIRKITSKLKSGIEPFCLCEIEFIQGKSFKTLTDSVCLEKFGNIRQYQDKEKTAFKISKAIKELVAKPEKDDRIWKLLMDSFYFLNNQKSKTDLVFPYFLWNLFSILGYLPELYNCPLCKKRIKPEVFYLISKEGGIVCGNCSSLGSYEREEKEFIKVNTAKLLRIFVKKPIGILEQLKVEKEDTANLDKVSESYFNSLKLNSFHGGENGI